MCKYLMLYPFYLKASIHMPRIGYQDRSEWYTVERLLRKYASLYGIKIFVYPSFPCSHSHDPHTQAHTLQSMNTPN